MLVLALVPLVVSCASYRRGPDPLCTAQNAEVLKEIAEGAAETCAPNLAAWERENARNCGWIYDDDWVEDVNPR